MKQRLLTLLKDNKVFFLLLLLYVIAGAVLLLVFPKGVPELWLNKHHSVFKDWLFMVATYMGDGIPAIVALIILFLVHNRKQALLLAACLISSSIVIQIIKIQLNYPRPSKFFENLQGVYYIDNLDLHSSFSFPSGHSGQAFSLFLIAAFLMRNKKWSPMLFLLAFLTAMSRVYLMQHFTLDVWTGAIIAVIVSTLVYAWLEPKIKPSLESSLLQHKARK